MCSLKNHHDKALCNYFHDNKDKRRDPKIINYSSEKCPLGYEKSYKCKFSDECLKAHNEIEVIYHKEVYKTRKCKDKTCKMGEKCSFDHSKEDPKEDLQAEIKKYKPANAVIEKELESVQEEMKDFEVFLCSFCQAEVGESILNCGHLTCSICTHGDSCDLCFLPILPIISIKLV